MPKRFGNLYDQCFTLEALFDAYARARKGKRKTLSVARFEAYLGANITALTNELASGAYLPLPCRYFLVHEPKTREIAAPHFRDVVVQHALYERVYPLFDSTFIHDSYGCRRVKGTHRAADRAQAYLRASRPCSFTLQCDIRKFYYRIDKVILRDLVSRRIKDKRIIDLIMRFAAEHEPIGVPIGSLMSQLMALVYLNPMDHFIKRQLKVKKYVRYVDDFILFDLDRDEAVEHRRSIETFLKNNLHLEFSRWTIAPTQRGVNFVGFRTWRKRRFVRKHSLFRFSRSLKSGNLKSLNSIMGNALRTSTASHFNRRIAAERPDLGHLLPHYKQP